MTNKGEKMGKLRREREEGKKRIGRRRKDRMTEERKEWKKVDGR